MGKIWLEKSGGGLIHLKIQESDYNTPDDPVKIPTSVVVNQDRCYGEVIAIALPGGTIHLDLRPEGITGLCNQCGMCCGHPIANCNNPDICGYVLHEDLNWHVCQYLDIKNWRKWGQTGNTTCSLYDVILDNFKGCAYPPDQNEIMLWWTSCGYSY